MIPLVFGLLVWLSLAEAPLQQATDHVILTLSQTYGRAVFRQCRLDVVISESRGVASLWCDTGASLDGKGRRIPDVNARQELASEETKRLIAGVRGARLFEGGHIGADGEPSDGVFETLKVVKDGQAVVLVTSYNPTFERDGPRKQVLSILNDIEQRLLRKAGR